MSIYDEINFWVNDGRLSLLEPVLPGSSAGRKMYVSPSVRMLLEGPWVDTNWAVRCGHLLADLDRYVTGETLAIAERPYKGKHSYMKRIDPIKAEVWAIRSRDPKPGIRIFGKFADKDVFIALTWAKRPDLGGPDSPAWNEAKNLCNHEWRKLFPASLPLSGDNFDDYISKIVLV